MKHYYGTIIIPDLLLERKLSNQAFAIAVALYNYNAEVEQTHESMFSVYYSPKHLARLCRLSTDATKKHIGELSETDIISKTVKTKGGGAWLYLKRFEHLAKNYIIIPKKTYDTLDPELLQAYLTVRYCSKHNISISSLETKPIGLRKLTLKGYIAPHGDTFKILKT